MPSAIPEVRLPVKEPVTLPFKNISNAMYNATIAAIFFASLERLVALQALLKKEAMAIIKALSPIAPVLTSRYKYKL